MNSLTLVLTITLAPFAAIFVAITVIEIAGNINARRENERRAAFKARQRLKARI